MMDFGSYGVGNGSGGGNGGAKWGARKLGAGLGMTMGGGDKGVSTADLLAAT